MSARDKDCYLHIGTHKTGSTWIRRFLSHSREELLSRGGRLPAIGQEGSNLIHTKLVSSLNTLADHGGNSPILRGLKNLLHGDDRDIIICSENMSEKIMRPRVLNSLKAWFKALGFRLNVFEYLRDQASYINSRYVKDVKHFKYGGFLLDRVGNLISVPESSHDYWQHYQPMINGPNIVREPRGCSSVRKHWLLEDFVSVIPQLAVAGILKNYHGTRSMNPNAGTRSVFVTSLFINSVEGIGKEDFRARLPRRHYLEHKWYESPVVGLDATLAEVIDRRHAEGNNRLARKFWNSAWGELNAPTPWKRNVFSFPEATTEERQEVMDLAMKLMSSIGDRNPNKKSKPKTGSKRSRKHQVSGQKSDLFPGISRLFGLRKGCCCPNQPLEA